MTDDTQRDFLILIVDDDAEGLQLLGAVLSQQHYNLALASSGQEALEQVAKIEPDLILLDIMMPGIDGFEICQRLKADPAHQAIPIIFLTARTESADIVKGFELGAADYVTKPFNEAELLARMRTHLALQRAKEETEEANRKLEEFNVVLADAAHEIQQANRAKSEFLANISHEIRTPMNAIMGYAQILRSQPALLPEQRQAVETIETSCDHLMGLINDVLDLSRIEAGHLELHPVDFDLEELVQGLGAMFQLRCKQKDLVWRVEMDQRAQWVHGDKNKLRQVLINLLGNAVKFTEEGTVKLSVRSEAESHYSFEVRDTGPGIVPERQATIFEPFEQDEVGARKGGTGLGLAIARRHVELMAGKLKLESTLGQGARFFFAVPLPPARESRAAILEARWERVAHLAPGCAVRVLVVDDVAANREVLAQTLLAVGVDATLAATAKEALAQAQRTAPALVFTDIRMPGMDGFELVQQLRAENAAVKMVAVSASVLAHERQRYVDAGFDHFIGKPFRREQIYACLAELLGVEYDYAPEQPSAASEEPLQEWGCVVLPEALLSRLREAAELYSVTEVEECLDELEATDAAGRQLATHLRLLNQQYNMDAILDILKEVRHE